MTKVIAIDDVRTCKARTGFWRLIAYLDVAGVAMVAAALHHLSL